MTRIVNAMIRLELAPTENLQLSKEERLRLERLMSAPRKATVYINYKMESVSIEFPDEELHIF